MARIARSMGAVDSAVIGAMLRHMRKLVVILFLSAFLPAAGQAKPKGITITVKNAKGADIGTVKIKPMGSAVSFKLNLRGLTPGEHGIHVHQNAKCEGPDFKSAGPHFNPYGKKHGLENPEGAHAGDMLNITVDDKGMAKATIVNKGVSLGSEPHSLFANGGTSLVIHAKPDDMKSDPDGNAGAGIACGVIVKP